MLYYILIYVASAGATSWHHQYQTDLHKPAPQHHRPSLIIGIGAESRWYLFFSFMPMWYFYSTQGLYLIKQFILLHRNTTALSRSLASRLNQDATFSFMSMWYFYSAQSLNLWNQNCTRSIIPVYPQHDTLLRRLKRKKTRPRRTLVIVMILKCLRPSIFLGTS